MKHRLTTLSIFIALFFADSYISAQTYQWVKGGGSNHGVVPPYDNEQINHMCTDANGNIYALGTMENGAIVADTFHRSSAYGVDNNVFLASYNCSGQMRWAKLIGATGNLTSGTGIAVDGLGHVYVSGSFPHASGTHMLYVGYDTTLATATYISQGVIQFDTTGEFNWIHLLGDNTTFSSSALGAGPVLVDAANNAHLICNTKYGAHITPSVVTHYGTYDIVFDPAGTILSYVKLSEDTTLAVTDAVLDKISNRLYVYGTRSNDYLTIMSYHPYIAAFDPARNLIWTDTLSNPFFPDNAYFSGIATDETGHLYLVGGGPSGVVYQGNAITNPWPMNYVAFVMKTGTDGHPQWIRNFGANSSYNALLGITLMPGNKIAAAGYMFGEVVCGTDTMYNYGGEGGNVYYTVLDTAGYVHRLDQLHGSGFNDIGNAITSDKKGSIYIGGEIETNVWAGSLTPYASVGGNTDFFIAKVGVDCGCTYIPVANYTVTGGTTKTFTYTGTTTGLDSVRWEFGDGGTSTLMNPTHPYTTGDTFTACVTVYTGCGSDMHCTEIIIPCVTAPTASYTTSGTGLTKTFTYTGTGLGTGTLSWTFGDGTPAVSGTPVTHTFSAAGTYVVCVAATNSCGTATSCNVIVVTCTTLPVSAFTISGSGASRSFTYTGTTAGLDSVTWTFGDGGTATGLTPSHTYATTGPKTVCATVHTNCGVHTQCNSFTILCITAPVAAFTATGTGAVASFTYTGTTTGIDSVHWDFGDGGTASGITPGHTYAATGTYHVCATAHTSCGNHTICHDVTINCIIPVTAAFTDTGNAIHGFAFTGTTTGLDSVIWDYGDGHSDTGISAHHTYTHSGTYHVCVTVYADCGNNTVCHDVVVSQTTEVAALSLANIRVFPNPATNELSITGIPETTTYRILTITGVNLKTGTLSKGDSVVALPDITTGIYILEMTGINGARSTIRFIKG